MNAPIKLLVNIDTKYFTERYEDPHDEVLKQLDAIEGIKYDILPFDEDGGNVTESLLEKGMTSLLNPGETYEALGSPYDKTVDIITTFRKFLDRIILSDHLILVDAYVFNDSNDGGKYAQFITAIFSEHLKKLQKITFITQRSTIKKGTQKAIVDGFLNIKRHLVIETKISELFHDRFWICGDRAIFVGTSFNGIGKKYSLIDYINKSDLFTIKKYLNAEGLL